MAALHQPHLARAPHPPTRLDEALTKQQRSKTPLQLTAPPLCLLGGRSSAFGLLRHTPTALEKQPCHFSVLCIIPAGGGIPQTRTSSAARQRHSSPSASAATPLRHQTRSPRVWAPDVPLPFQTPAPSLPQLLGGHRAETGVPAARLLPDARWLLSLQGPLALPKAVLQSKSMCSTVTSWKRSLSWESSCGLGFQSARLERCHLLSKEVPKALCLGPGGCVALRGPGASRVSPSLPLSAALPGPLP